MEPLGTVLAVQLGLTAIAKWRARGTRMRLAWRQARWSLPTGVLAALDAVLAVSLAVPQTARAGAFGVLAMIGLGVVVADRGPTPCGCFGLSDDGSPWRNWAARSLMAAEALATGVLPTGTRQYLVWIVGVAATAAVVLLQPQLVRWRARPRPSAGLATRLLAASPQFRAWRPLLLSDRPARVTVTGRAVHFEMDAWRDDSLVLLIAEVAGGRVRVRAYEPFTLTSLES